LNYLVEEALEKANTKTKEDKTEVDVDHLLRVREKEIINSEK
jgi:hypothetical protein